MAMFGVRDPTFHGKRPPMRPGTLVSAFALVVLLVPRASAARPLFGSPFLSFDTGLQPYGIAHGDLNEDGRLDIAVANSGSVTHSVSVLLGEATGGFGPATSISTTYAARGIAIADVDRDGHLDLVLACFSASKVTILPGTGAGTFNAGSNLTVGSGPVSVAVGDVNGDGWPDVVSANFNASTVSVLLDNGNGTFA